MTSKKKRQRGSKTHSSGSMKNKRGAGHKGGRGESNSGKRGDAVKPSYWRDKESKGFTSLEQKHGKGDAINLSDVNERLDTFKEHGIAYE
ncbi:MAG: 50S ribosomal protein L15, partial [Halobacteriaceae archaeon]